MTAQATKNAIPAISLNNGAAMPVLGIGTWDMQDTEQAIQWALEAGYRHIDTAKIYDTEEGIGKAVRQSAIPREELFIVTKLWNTDQGYNTALMAMDESLAKLQMDYVDLYLVHWPTTDEWSGENKREETWKAMEEIFHSGKARTIGVSNYKREHLEEMKIYAAIPPAVNQIEFHPFWFRKELMDYCHEHGIAVTDYCPLTRTKRLDNPVIGKIARKHEKTPAQVLLRWGIQHGNIVIPQSSNQAHIQENMDIFDFELEEQDMINLNGLNQNWSAL